MSVEISEIIGGLSRVGCEAIHIFEIGPGAGHVASIVIKKLLDKKISTTYIAVEILDNMKAIGDNFGVETAKVIFPFT